MGLIDRMKIATDMQNMSMGEKFLGSLQVTIFGMAIVFIALLLLFLIIKTLETALYGRANKENTLGAKKEAVSPQAQAPNVVEKELQDDSQLVAVITAAIAASLHTSIHNIVVRNIVRVPDATPAWGKLGRMQQLNRMD